MILETRSAKGPPVTRLRGIEATDSYGDSDLDWSDPDRLVLRGAEVQSPASTEAADPNGPRLTDIRIVRIPGRADVTAADRIQIGDEIYRVEGNPIIRRGLAIGTATAVDLRRITR